MGTHRSEHLLRLRNRNGHSNPVASRRLVTRLPLETVAFQPFIHGVDAVRVRRHERLDVRLRQMFSVARVERIADLREVLLELGEALLGKRDAERDDVGGWCAP